MSGRCIVPRSSIWRLDWTGYKLTLENDWWHAGGSWCSSWFKWRGNSYNLNFQLIVHFVTKVCVKQNPILSKDRSGNTAELVQVIPDNRPLYEPVDLGGSTGEHVKCCHYQLTKQHQRKGFSSSFVILNQKYIKLPQALVCWMSYSWPYTLYQVYYTILKTTEIISPL